jgi:orotidine-5'-phosphate decarboxylase
MRCTASTKNTVVNMVPEKLINTAEETKSLLCFGVDPVLSRMGKEAESKERDAKEKILSYFPPIIDALLEENVISAIKPNYAYFAAEGFGGLHALAEIISRYKDKTFVILDAKRGDIGKSSEAYARECYDFWGADAVTIHPYMGKDSVSPFVREGAIPYMQGRNSNPGAKDFQEKHISTEGKFPYVLGRTSNAGAKDFQEKALSDSGNPLYFEVFRKAKEWGTGLVVGATSDAIPKAVELAGEDVPLLIPGIGSQGGSYETLSALRKNPLIHRINSSSAIAYAHEKMEGSPESCAMEVAKETAQKISEKVF